MPDQNQEVAAKLFLQQLELLLENKDLTKEQQQEVLKKFVELEVLTEPDTSSQNLKNTKKQIKLQISTFSIHLQSKINEDDE